MAEIIERLTGRTLDDLAKAYVFNPLAMKDTMYRPAKKLWPWIAPTEIDNNLRHRLVQGEGHDENAFAIGGRSEHAGLSHTRPPLSPCYRLRGNRAGVMDPALLRRVSIPH